MSKLSEREFRLCAILIVLTIGPEDPLDIEDAALALESCYGYSQHQSRPMMWYTLDKIGRECN